ncbi:Defender against cell death protein/oligosaccharyltransferase, epsilon subunit [Phaffia rhodozyma]|uniref:Dolichyl-diphosphooligosaccharide--protein glycosyltransferase subunit OST2 n=1 Tax=Phaffia rhodozyma TaxID=264483 RepID=A0A0F7SXL4_PHARH|nr:Defender against cell death protein/oligosaccharyltransferase, epsilon subunit [Phaffia rhodozyma]
MAPTSVKGLKKAAAQANPKTTGSTSSGSSTSSALSSSVNTLVQSYKRTTPSKVKLIDCFLLFFLLSGVAQFAYCVGVTSFPYNAFLGGFASAAGQFVLLAGLRAQIMASSSTLTPLVSSATSTSPSATSPDTTSIPADLKVNPNSEFQAVSKERAFADFCFASIILHFFVFNFLG